MHSHLPFLPLLLALGLLPAGCGSKTDDSAVVEGDADADSDVDTDTDTDTGPLDHDGDGVPAWQDCDDDDAGVGGPATWYADHDQDGWGDEASSTEACEQPSGSVDQPGDCDDDDPAVNPDATEICNGLDDDCDGLVDDEDDSLDLATRSTFYEDADGDGWGLDTSTTEACAAPTGWAEQGGDCDDGDAVINPDAWDVVDGVDNDCDGTADVMSLAAADVVLEGDSGEEHAGATIAGRHDLNGDGYTDLLIGAPGADTTLWDAGEAYVVYGPVLANMSLASSDAIITGTETWGYLGSRLVGLWDVHGDGYDDVVLQTMGWTDRDHSAGAVYLFPGPVSGSMSMTDARLAIQSDLLVNNSLAEAGDTDGDGLGDIIISARDNDMIWVVSGAELAGSGTLDLEDLASPILSAQVGDQFGWFGAIDGVGDIDADGLNDIAVGAPFHDSEVGSSTGEVYLFSAAEGWPASARGALATISGAYPCEGLGVDLDGGTDLDGDDIPDTLIGSYERDVDPADARGAVYFASGAFLEGALTDTSLDVLIGEPGEKLGSTVAILGDVDSDGTIEFGTQASGDWYSGTTWPSFFVSEIPTGEEYETYCDLAFSPPTYASLIGLSNEGVGDLNADAIADIAITDAWAGPTYIESGAIYLFFGR